MWENILIDRQKRSSKGHDYNHIFKNLGTDLSNQPRIVCLCWRLKIYNVHVWYGLVCIKWVIYGVHVVNAPKLWHQERQNAANRKFRLLLCWGLIAPIPLTEMQMSLLCFMWVSCIGLQSWYNIQDMNSSKQVSYVILRRLRGIIVIEIGIRVGCKAGW